MKKFTNFTSVVAPLIITNIDTDMIIPKDFLKTLKRTGLGTKLFYEMRYDKNGVEIANFVLNNPEFKNAQILLAGDNFGCGSSREHAPWALADFGIFCVISTSFADIFYNNCFKNSILPAIVSKADHEALCKLVTASQNTSQMEININDKTIAIGNHKFAFSVDDERKKILVEGLDDIAQTLKNLDSINAFEQNTLKPWLKA